MDKEIDAHFERLEKALTNLVDSVTKFHPSTAQAKELVDAETELNKGLLQVERHQRNHQRILKLRAAAEANDAKIRDTLRTLADVRRDLKAAPATAYPKTPAYPVEYRELLAFARRISKTTMPPPGVTNGVDLAPPNANAPAPTGGSFRASPSADPPGGTPAPGPGSTAQTPLPTTQPQSQSQSQAQSPAAPLSQTQTPLPDLPGTQTSLLTSATSLPDGLSQHLNPLSDAVFLPWPTEDKIRSGALAVLQQLSDQNIDPRNHDPVEEERKRIKAEEERREAEERRRIEMELERRRMEEEKARKRQAEREKEAAELARRGSMAVSSGGVGVPGLGGARSGSIAGAAGGQGEKKQFQFTSMDDEDLDDD